MEENIANNTKLVFYFHFNINYILSKEIIIIRTVKSEKKSTHTDRSSRSKLFIMLYFISRGNCLLIYLNIVFFSILQVYDFYYTV